MGIIDVGLSIYGFVVSPYFRGTLLGWSRQQPLFHLLVFILPALCLAILKSLILSFFALLKERPRKNLSLHSLPIQPAFQLNEEFQFDISEILKSPLKVSTRKEYHAKSGRKERELITCQTLVASRPFSTSEFPYPARFVVVHGLRIHYIDEGRLPLPGSPGAILLVHGGLTWSYLYRRVIPLLVAAGQRVVALDLPGYGFSDKLAKPSDISPQLHLSVLKIFMDKVGLHHDVTLVLEGEAAQWMLLGATELQQGPVTSVVLLDPQPWTRHLSWGLAFDWCTQYLLAYLLGPLHAAATILKMRSPQLSWHDSEQYFSYWTLAQNMGGQGLVALPPVPPPPLLPPYLLQIAVRTIDAFKAACGNEPLCGNHLASLSRLDTRADYLSPDPSWIHTNRKIQRNWSFGSSVGMDPFEEPETFIELGPAVLVDGLNPDASPCPSLLSSAISWAGQAKPCLQWQATAALSMFCQLASSLLPAPLVGLGNFLQYTQRHVEAVRNAEAWMQEHWSIPTKVLLSGTFVAAMSRGHHNVDVSKAWAAAITAGDAGSPKQGARCLASMVKVIDSAQGCMLPEERPDVVALEVLHFSPAYLSISSSARSSSSYFLPPGHLSSSGCDIPDGNRLLMSPLYRNPYAAADSTGKAHSGRQRRRRRSTKEPMSVELFVESSIAGRNSSPCLGTAVAMDPAMDIPCFDLKRSGVRPSPPESPRAAPPTRVYTPRACDGTAATTTAQQMPGTPTRLPWPPLNTPRACPVTDAELSCTSQEDIVSPIKVWADEPMSLLVPQESPQVPSHDP